MDPEDQFPKGLAVFDIGLLPRSHGVRSFHRVSRDQLMSPQWNEANGISSQFEGRLNKASGSPEAYLSIPP